MTTRTVIAVAGWAHEAADMKALTSALAARGVEALAVSPADLLSAANQRASVAVCKDTGVSLYAQALKSMAEGPEALSLVGWSMGALIVLEAAGRLSLPAEKMVLLGATAKFCACDGYACGVPVRDLRAMEVALRRRPAGVLGRFYRDAACPRALSPATAERRAAAAISRGVEALTDGLRYLQRTDLRDALANVRCPVLAVHGRQDRIVPWEAGRLLGERLARCEFVLHDDAGHDLVAAAPDAQCSRVSEFLEV